MDNLLISSQNIITHIISAGTNLNIKTFNLKYSYLDKYNFITPCSKDIKPDLLVQANLIDRTIGITQLEKYIEWFYAYEIEKGIFEFSLVKIIIDKLPFDFVKYIYMDKLHDICENINRNNKFIDNQTLVPLIMDKNFKPFYVAFLSPNQLHPKRWQNVVAKLKVKEETIRNVATTDLYTCKKCGEKKFTILEVQMRSADEPSSKICTCTVCNNTFVL